MCRMLNHASRITCSLACGCSHACTRGGAEKTLRRDGSVLGEETVEGWEPASWPSRRVVEAARGSSKHSLAAPRSAEQQSTARVHLGSLPPHRQGRGRRGMNRKKSRGRSVRGRAADSDSVGVPLAPRVSCRVGVISALCASSIAIGVSAEFPHPA